MYTRDAHEPKIRERFLRAEASGETNKLMGNRDYHLFLCFVDNWIQIVLYFPNVVYITCSRSITMKKGTSAYIEIVQCSFLIENLLRVFLFSIQIRNTQFSFSRRKSILSLSLFRDKEREREERGGIKFDVCPGCSSEVV